MQNKILFCKLLCRMVTVVMQRVNVKVMKLWNAVTLGFGNFIDMLIFLCMDSNFSFSLLHSGLQKRQLRYSHFVLFSQTSFKQSSWMYICLINKHLISVNSTCLYIQYLSSASVPLYWKYHTSFGTICFGIFSHLLFENTKYTELYSLLYGCEIVTSREELSLLVCEYMLLRKGIWMQEYGCNRMEKHATRSFIHHLQLDEGQDDKSV